MIKRSLIFAPLILFLPLTFLGQDTSDGTWQFAVSGDSRNCGDVVMPAIARSVLEHHVDFYWHLGDFRFFGIAPDAIDEDMLNQYGSKLDLDEYRRIAWGDFLSNQIAPFGSLPVFLGIGNHELYISQDKTQSRAAYSAQFAYWLDRPQIYSQRLADGTPGSFEAYYHWTSNQVDFIYLDNSEDDGFKEPQLKWLDGVLNRDASNPNVLAIVVGMHRALPNSLACGHSMNGDPPAATATDPEKKKREETNLASTMSGRHAYESLLKWKTETNKFVYILASHSHFFMAGVFKTPYWENVNAGNRGVLPGWIVGTAGARRYQLPRDLPSEISAITYAYGYLLGTVKSDGSITFEFQELTEKDVPTEICRRYGTDFIDFCFLANRDDTPHKPADSCNDK
jgi:hypothetical protein